MARRFLAVIAVVLALSQAASAKPWLDEKFNTDGTVRTGYDASGQQVVTLSLDQRSGAGFNSDEQYLYGKFSIQMKLIPGNSAGTVSCFYLSSGDGDGHDEIDMEFMGNSSGPGHPVVLNTNVWVNGDGKKEHQFNLWFDPAADFHTYTIIWNPENILFKVDDLFIRSFKRFDGIPYTSSKPMRLHATLWDGSFWATEKGKVPIDWSNAPFNVLHRLVPQLLRQRLRQRRRVPFRQRRVDEQAARRRRVGHREVGGAELHELQLLRGWVQVPSGVPRRVQPLLIPALI
uniref:Xyloglucan endotransglycosylase/hydrolase protein 8 n=1 Tax=Aegilops tauschii TaxID=37682 RepID=M8C6R8_AEGTA